MIKKEKWDGRSRIPTKQYKENYDKIFKKEKTLSEMLAEGFEKEQRDQGAEWAQKKKE